MGVPDTGSIEAAWQTLHVVSSATLAAPPRLIPSLFDEPQPAIRKAMSSDNTATMMLLFFRFILFYLLVHVGYCVG